MKRHKKGVFMLKMKYMIVTFTKIVTHEIYFIIDDLFDFNSFSEIAE